MGQIRQTTQTFLGQFSQVIACPNCQGEGMRIEKPCSNCKGRGQVRKSRDIEVKVPAGVDFGARMRVQGEGDKGRKAGPPGDLYVILHVKEHSIFIREGTTIHVNQPISFSMSALGGELLVPTVEGAKILKIPAGTQTGTSLVMREQGVPVLSNPTRRGDQVVHLIVDTPAKLSSEEKKIFERLAELRGEQLTVSNLQKKEETQKNGGNIFEKITEVFKPKDSADEA
jgi:molecular chaperone DnaJ